MPETWREERRERAASAALGDKPKGEPAAVSRRGVVNAKMTADNKVELSLEDFRELVGAKATASEDLAAQLAKFAPKVAVALATADKPPRKVRRAEQRLAAADARVEEARAEEEVSAGTGTEAEEATVAQHQAKRAAKTRNAHGVVPGVQVRRLISRHVRARVCARAGLYTWIPSVTA